MWEKIYKNLPTRMILKISLDIVAFIFAYILSHLLRFEIIYLEENLNKLITFLPIYVLVRVTSNAIFRLYPSMWRYTSIPALNNLIKATLLGSALLVVISYFTGIINIPRSIFVLDWLLVLFFCGGLRIAIRYIYSNQWLLKPGENSEPPRKILIYGAGRAGEVLLRNILNTVNTTIEVIGFIDDNPNKKGRYLHNKPVLGDGNRIAEFIKKYDINGIYISIPSLSGVENRRILTKIKSQVSGNIEIKTIPGLLDWVNGRFSINQLRNFELKDLLRRKPVELDHTPVKELIHRKSVLVVGGGGSIGSELCSQIALYNPSQLIILDNSEYNLYTIEANLSANFSRVEIICLAADACDEKMMRKVFNYYQPDLVFHAAAYKHVPLMEMNPWAATYNNLKSTLVLTTLSKEYSVKRFILISTDKAVQPTSVMGATKRMCEIITQIHNHSGYTKFITVRFGNVLGSSGSVIPKFKEQIEVGGPITVTHPEITRYFMLVSEAVELVLQAAAIGGSGNIYVLDMGEPIKIIDLARYMIELSGLKLDEDIKIEFTGMRPGEKIRESLFLSGEECSTEVPYLFVINPSSQEDNKFIKEVNAFLSNLYKMNHAEIRQALKRLVPEYEPYEMNDYKLPFINENGNSIQIKYLP